MNFVYPILNTRIGAVLECNPIQKSYALTDVADVNTNMHVSTNL